MFAFEVGDIRTNSAGELKMLFVHIRNPFKLLVANW